MKKLKLNKYKFLELADKPNELELKNYYNKDKSDGYRVGTFFVFNCKWNGF